MRPHCGSNQGRIPAASPHQTTLAVAPSMARISPSKISLSFVSVRPVNCIVTKRRGSLCSHLLASQEGADMELQCLSHARNLSVRAGGVGGVCVIDFRICGNRGCPWPDTFPV